MQDVLLGIISGLILTWLLTTHTNNGNRKKYEPITEPIVNINQPFDMLGGRTPANLSNITYSKTRLGWIENSRNNLDYKKYPPCFNLSLPAQKIFDILASNNLVVKHKVLLEVYSMILCQVNYLQSKLCPQTMLIDRLENLDSFGALRYTNHYQNLTKYVSKQILYSTSPMTLEFLNKSLYLIDKEINQIILLDLPKDSIDYIKQFNESICSYAFLIIAVECYTN